MEKIKYIIILILCINIPVHSQTKGKITGLVEDNLGPVGGVTVVVKGTTNGNITDMAGHFSLENVNTGAIIQFSFIGYMPQEIQYTGQPSIHIKLLEDTQTLEEVVITGYGGVQKAKTLTASAVNVKMEQIAKLPVTSVSDGLGGRVPGITSQGRSGAPGETTKIWIRGGGNILYVIDDVVMETAQGEVFFNRLRPDDIAAISVLKDASATAVYGPRAADGVVVVSTKKGVSGKMEITFNQKLSVMTPSYKMKVMDSYDYVQVRNELYAANFAESPAYNDTELSKYYMGHLSQQGKSRNEILNMVNEKYNMGYTLQDINDLFNPMVTQGGNIQDYYQTHDPWKFFDHTQPMYQTNLSVRGGGDRVRYYTSLGILSQKGISDSFAYDQYNALVNTEAFLLNDKSLKFTLNFNGVVANKKRPAGGENIFNRVLIESSFMPNLPKNWSNGLRRAGGPDALLETGYNNDDDYRLQTSMNLKWDLPWVKGLTVSTSLNFNTSYNMNKVFEHNEEGVYGNPAASLPNNFNPEDAKVEQIWSNYLLTTGIYQIEYNNSWGKHNFSVMANYQSQVRHTNHTRVKVRGYPTTFVPQIGAGTTFESKDGGEGKWGSASYIGRITYDYNNKYLLQYSVNYNGSLSYSPGKRWGFFQAVSAGWVITEEDFFKEWINPQIVSMFKLRAGYGIVGGESADPFSYMNQYAQSDVLLLGENMGANASWMESHVANDLTWTSSRQLSGGVDFGFLKNRLTGSFDTYLYMNHGAPMDMNEDLVYTPLFGMPNTPQINAPFETSRKGGIEFTLNWNDKIRNFHYRLGMTYSMWDQRVTRNATKDVNWYYPNRTAIGKRQLQDVYKQVFTATGLYGDYEQMYNSILYSNFNYNLGTFIIKDLNRDGVLDEGDRIHNSKPGGSPMTTYGFNIGGGWKGLDIDVFFQGASRVTGNTPSAIRSQQDYYWTYGKYLFANSYMPSANNYEEAILPMPGFSGQSFGSSFIDWWVYDASYIKLKNITVRYDLKRDLLKHLSLIEGLELTFIANNVFTWVNNRYSLKGTSDPEYIPMQGIWGSNNKLGSYPTQRSYTLGLTLTL